MQPAEIERLKASGEMILAYAAQIAAEQKMLLAETAAGMLKIPLDPQLSAVENAKKYFNKC